MSLLQFLRLLGRHALLLALVPLAMAAAAYWATRELPREYAASATLYTGFVSGYSIDSEEGARADYLTTQTAFDNLIQLIKSRRAVEHVALTLLAMEASGELRLEDYDAQEDVGLVRTVASRAGRASTPVAYARFAAQKNEVESPVYAALYVDPSPFNVSTLQAAIQASRVGNSDMVEVRYTAPDAVLAQVTLQVLLGEVVTEFREMKTRETGDIVAFFEEETAAASAELRGAVAGMRDFGVRNRIINYYEQTKYVASQKEQLDHEVQQEEMALAAAEDALRDTERRLSEREAVLVQSEAVAEQRRALSAATARLARAEAVATPAAPGEDAPEASGAADPATVDSLRAALDGAVRGLHRLTHSEQGVSRGTLTGAWLDHATTVTEGRARLAVLRQRRDEYQRVYDVFAPLGSTLNSLEREVDIAEGTYMEMLHSLNLARMRQKSLEQSANLDVVAPPERPARPLSSKRPLLVAVAFMAGLVLCVGGLLGVEVLDQSMRTPERAAEVSGLPLAGAYPVAPASEAVLKPLDAQFLRTVDLALRERDARVPQLVVVASGQAGEGAGFVASRLAERFAARGRAVRYLAPHAEGGAEPYALTEAFPEAEALADLAPAASPEASGAELTVLELPPVLDAPLPLGLLARADVALLAARASRSWATADAHTAEALERATGHAPHLVLTGAQPIRLEGLVGEIPRKRSGLRRRLKSLARFEFSR